MSGPATRPGTYRGENGELEQSSPRVFVSGNGNSTSTSFSWIKNANKDVILGFMLGIALIEGAALFYEWRHKAQQSELEQYKLSDFESTHFNPLAAQVQSDHDLIQAYGLQKLVADTCRR